MISKMSKHQASKKIKNYIFTDFLPLKKIHTFTIMYSQTCLKGHLYKPNHCLQRAASFSQLMNRAYRLSTFLLQPPEQQEAMTKNFKYHSPEYRATKTHTSPQQSKHGIACQHC